MLPGRRLDDVFEKGRRDFHFRPIEDVFETKNKTFLQRLCDVFVGWSPLHLATQNGHARICTILLESNARVNQQKEDGVSPLYIASQKGHVHICTMLLENNAFVNQQNNNGVSPLHITAEKGFFHICALLIKSSAHVNLQMKDGTSPLSLWMAAQNGHVYVCNLLTRMSINK